MSRSPDTGGGSSAAAEDPGTAPNTYKGFADTIKAGEWPWPLVSSMDPEIVRKVEQMVEEAKRKWDEHYGDHISRAKDITTKFGQLTSWYSRRNDGAYMGTMDYPKGWKPA